MTISDALDVAGSMAGLVLLAVMALVPLLLALPLPRAAPRGVTIPAQRSGPPALRVHTAV